VTTSREMLLVGGVAKRLKQKGSWVGETHIQKTCFVAKIRRNLPIESEFVLYKHGPYSFDLNKSLAHMQGRMLLLRRPNPGYGPTLELNEALWNALDRSLKGLFSRYESDISDVCDFLGKKNVAELEKIATAIYVADVLNLPKGDQAGKITEIKPHISIEAAREAVHEASSFS